ncbi:hypothetical protein [Accumulibacter sp.]|uniref:hypothetical protein n=1 Tax=Accumulibacter sp. TaxID=2053492 RepID=UPI0025ECB659|nr:hypothetical protein [Accumulibacter sp.]MCM8594548.1 hypothetical protein [Accumulibacter sp.]MCM8627396.1 hypothetical protein [Accumulibacter sp.]MDS4048694.1 hypothetical protein [Accumulibacter sp.]
MPLALAVVLLQFGLLEMTLPLSELFSGKPLFHIDHPYHLYQIEQGRALLKQGLLTGYDPYFVGGNLGGVTSNASSRVPVLVSALLPDTVPTEVLYKVYVFVCALLAPLALIGMGRALRWPLLHTALAAVVGVLLFWVGELRWYFMAGMVSYVLGCYVGLAYGAWVWSVCAAAQQGITWRILAAGVSGGLGLWLHPLFGLLPAVLFLALLVVDRQRLSLPMTGRALAIVVIAVALNLPWLLSMGTAEPHFIGHPYQRAVGIDVLLQPLLGIGGSPVGSFLNPAICAVALIGLVVVDRTGRARLLPLVIAGWSLLLFGAFGATSERLASLQPNRFIAAGFLTLGMAAAFVIGQCALGGHSARQRIAAMVTLVIAVFALAFGAREVVREVSPGKHARYGKLPAEVLNQPASYTFLASWLAENTSPDGRILFETSMARVHGGAHVAGILAKQIGREFIGSPYPYSLPDVSFWDGHGFGGKIDGLSEERFLAGLERYNVGWIVAHSAPLKRLLSRIPIVEPVAQYEGIEVYRVRRSLSYVAEGAARIESREFNRVVVSDAAGERVTLRYNWVPGLATEPPAQVVPAADGSGFRPLVTVIDPPPRFTLKHEN